MKRLFGKFMSMTDKQETKYIIVCTVLCWISFFMIVLNK